MPLPIKFTRQEFKKAYQAYLESDHWRKLKVRKLNVHPWCQLCPHGPNRPHAVEVHHTIYRNFYDIGLNDLMSLCKECHSKIHADFKHPFHPWNLRKEAVGQIPTRKRSPEDPIGPWRSRQTVLIDRLRDQHLAKVPPVTPLEMSHATDAMVEAQYEAGRVPRPNGIDLNKAVERNVVQRYIEGERVNWERVNW